MPKDRLKAAFDELRYLKKIRNQTDFGDKLDYNKTYVSRLFNGHEPITYQIATEIQKVFGINANWLLSGEGSMFIETPEQKIVRIENERMTQALKIATGNRSVKVEDVDTDNTQDTDNPFNNLKNDQQDMTLERVLRMAEALTDTIQRDSITRQEEVKVKQDLADTIKLMTTRLLEDGLPIKKQRHAS